MAIQDFPVLTLITILPLVGAVMVALLPKGEDGVVKTFAFTWSTLVFLTSLVIFAGFNPAVPGMQLVDNLSWIDEFGIRFSLGIDGISLWLVILTTFLTPVVVLGAFKAVPKYMKGFMFSILLLETAMIGTLLATDIFLFYVFWELMLIPMYFLIGIWGGQKRLYAAVKFFIFTMVGSLLMLLALIYVYYQHFVQFGIWSTDLHALLQVQFGLTEQILLFIAFALAFAIKVPMWPLHTWLPDAHTEAPTAGSVILAGVLLKMGTYGFLRFAIPLFPVAAAKAMPVIAALAVVGIIYGALVAFVQKDVKRLVAYSSVSHLGFVMLGIAGMTFTSVQGGLYQMLNHGISTGALFLVVGMIYERRHTRMISDFGGLAKVIPLFATMFMITMLSSIGVPGLNGFVGEFLILTGTFTSQSLPYAQVWVVLGTTGVLLGAVYMLHMYQRVMFGPVTKDENKALKDLSVREVAVLLPLILLMFVMGLFPNLFLKYTESSIHDLLKTYNAKVERYEQREASLSEPRLGGVLAVGQSATDDTENQAVVLR